MRTARVRPINLNIGNIRYEEVWTDTYISKTCTYKYKQTDIPARQLMWGPPSSSMATAPARVHKSAYDISTCGICVRVVVEVTMSDEPV